MGTYDSERRDALELIREYGEAATLRVFAQTVPDAAEPWENGAPTNTELTARMVFLNFRDSSNSGASGERYWNGTLIHTGDKKVLLAAEGLAFAPELNAHVIRADGSVWKVVNFKDLDPNGEKILYTLQVRQ